MLNYNLIQATTKDKLKLTGLAKFEAKEKTAYIFIHGFTADFYSHDFYHQIANQLSSQGNTIVLAQHRGTGMVSEVHTEPDGNIHLGSYFEKIEDAHLDITAYVSALKEKGYTSFGLIGHSLGTIKGIGYLFEGELKGDISSLILLAPFDKNAYMERKMPGKLQQLVTKAKQKIADGGGREIVPVPEFEDFAMSYQTFVSWYEESDLSNMFDFYKNEYDFPTLKSIQVPTLVVLGDKDEFISFPEFDVSPGSTLSKMKKLIPDCNTVMIEDCDHNFSLEGDELAKVVGEFVG
jgi:pimeloyl-ACP methyl ester carboxylesterase